MAHCSTYIIGKYTPNLLTSKMDLIVPETAVCGEYVAGSPCRISIVAWRDRKTGPEHSLAMCACRGHDCRFMVYTVGFTQFARKKIDVDVEASGVLQAVKDAEENKLWPEISGAEGLGVRGTQKGYILKILTLFGLFNPSQVPQIAFKLDIPVTALKASLSTCTKPFKRQAWGAVAIALIGQLKVSALTILKLLECGRLTHLWGRSVLWKSERSGVF